MSMVKHFDIHNQWSVILLATWLVFSIFYAFLAGRGKSLTVLFSTYISLLFLTYFPEITDFSIKYLGKFSDYSFLLGFIVLFFLFFLLFSRYGIRSTVETTGIISMPFVVIFAFLQTGLLIQIVLSHLSLGFINQLDPLLPAVFLSKYSTLIWLCLPLICLFITGRFVVEQEQ